MAFYATLQSHNSESDNGWAICGCASCMEANKDLGEFVSSEGTKDGIAGGDGPLGFNIGQTPGTAGTIAVGQTLNGVDQVVDFSGDEDWYGINLVSGSSYGISLFGSSGGAGGGTLGDTYLRIYDSAGNLIASNDDSGGSLNSFLNFVATYSGTFYISAGAFGSNTGTYTISVTESVYNPNDNWTSSPTFTNPVLSAMSWTTMHDSLTLDVYFLQAGESADGITSEGWNAYQQQQMVAALNAISAVSGLSFNIVNQQQGADLELVLDTNEMASSLYGYFNPPGYGGDGNDGVGAFNGNLFGSSAGGDLEVGGFGYFIFMHELLHGMGLSHPHDTGGGSTILPGVTSSRDDFGDYDLNQGIFTVMSYNPAYHTGTPGSEPAGGTGGGSGVNYGYASGPSAIDIGVLQALYGANTNHNNAANNYYLPTGTGLGVYWQTIWDTGGVDNIRHTGSGNAQIDLRAATLQLEEGGGGFVSAVDGTRGGFTIANGVVIENAFGGTGNDVLYGNTAANVLVGGDGEDTLNGFSGADTLSGGAGNDSLIGSLGHDRLVGGFGNDDMSGGSHNDTLLGGGDNDTMAGGTGDDSMEGGTGNDSMDGDGGEDQMFGNAGSDTLDGGTENDLIDGGATGDFLYGRGGNDTMRGDHGFDEMWFGFGSDLGFGGTQTDRMYGETGNDTLYGQDGNDLIVGGNGNDHLYGNNNNDRIFGGAGRDFINGGNGNDELTGNLNNDVFIFSGAHGNDTIIDFAANAATERLDFSMLGTMNNFAQVNAAMSQVGADVLIQTSASSSIRLLNVNIADITALDFYF